MSKELAVLERERNVRIRYAVNNHLTQTVKLRLISLVLVSDRNNLGHHLRFKIVRLLICFEQHFITNQHLY